MRVSPGSVAQLTVSFANEIGELVDPQTVYADIFGPDGLKVDNGVPVRISLGFYRYDYAVAADAIEGLWRVDWESIIGGLSAFGNEVFEVAAAGVVVSPGYAVTISRLRSRLAEVKTDSVGNGSETFFDDNAISDLLAYAVGDLDQATLEGWKRKMASYARLVDVSESGTDRPMSQKFKHAQAMVAMWSRILSDLSDSLHAAMRGRIVGKPVNLGYKPLEGDLGPFGGYTDHIREYPTHRLLIPTIKR